MNNLEAIKRIQEKLRYTESKIAEGTSEERVNRYRRLDCDAFALAIAALEYTEAMTQYEISKL